MQPVLRPTVRVILIDESQRVLMFRHEGDFRTEDFAGASLWALPGGGVEAGESHEEAARRELWEETGLVEPDIGPCVWLRDLVLEWNGKHFDCRERYHVCHAANFAIDPANQSPQERIEMTASYWWSLEEITNARDDAFAPRNLAALLSPILRGDYPNEPLRIGI
jgi:8-oxo-dGTP pyrophosphatase MutT (NUDIX family)